MHVCGHMYIYYIHVCGHMYINLYSGDCDSEQVVWLQSSSSKRHWAGVNWNGADSEGMVLVS